MSPDRGGMQPHHAWLPRRPASEIRDDGRSASQEHEAGTEKKRPDALRWHNRDPPGRALERTLAVVPDGHAVCALVAVSDEGGQFL